MFKRTLRSLYHFIGYIFAAAVISAAIFVTAVRLALPGIANYKNEIQSWFSDYMGYPVIFKSITAEWQGWVPRLYIEDITLYTQNNKQIITRLNSVNLEIDLLSSLTHVKVVPNKLSVIGLDLMLTRKPDGSFSISNSQDKTQNILNKNSETISTWLFKQKYITLENSRLTFNDEKIIKPIKHFENVYIELKTTDQRVQLNASILPDEYGQTASIYMDIFGDILTPKWDGEIYIETNHTNPSDLFNALPINSIGENINITLWTHWQQARLIDFYGEIDYREFTLKSNSHELPIDSIYAVFDGNRQNNENWLLNVKLDDIKTPNGSWPSSRVQVEINRNNNDNYNYSAYLSYLKLEDILPFIPSKNVLPDDILNKVNWRSIKGELSDFHFMIRSDAQRNTIFQARSQFNRLSVNSNDKINSLPRLHGSFDISTDKLNTTHKQSIAKSETDVDRISDNTPILMINRFNITNEQFPFSLSGNIKFDPESPFIDLIAHIDETDIENIPAYLPNQTDVKFKKWIKQALAGGTLLSADMIYRGYINDFPFDEAEGHFQAILNVDNITLEYMDNWPPVDNLTAEILFKNNDLYINAGSGYLYDAEIKNLHAAISNFDEKAPHILINGKLTGHTNDANYFITQSPLKNTSPLFELTQNDINGNIELDIKLDIPLDKNKTNVNGTITLINTTFKSNLSDLKLKNINGQIEFTRDVAWATGIKALYQNTPIEIAIPKKKENQLDTHAFLITSKVDKQFIIEQLTNFFPSLHIPQISDYFNGQSEWIVKIKQQINNKNNVSLYIELSSDLNGIAIDLPAPLAKQKNQTRPIKIKTTLINSLIEQIDINYDNHIYTHILIDKHTQNSKIKKINIGLGQAYTTNSDTHSLVVEGQLDKLDISKWIQLFDTNIQSQNKAVTEKTNLYDIYTKELYLFKHKLTDTRWILTEKNDGWDISINGNQIKGHASLSKAEMTKNMLLNANLDHVILNNVENEVETTYSIEKWPQLDIKIDEFTYKDHHLGIAKLLTTNHDKGISIKELSFDKPGFKIKAEGTWLQTNKLNHSKFIATLNSDSINTMLSTFGYDATNNIKGEQTKIKLNGHWTGSPMNFSIKKMNGELYMDIGKGQLLNIDPKAGRLFGLLSIQTLPRRLAFDFSDIFNKGFTFDGIKGNFSLQQGHAYTNDLELNSLSANIIISGRTGLITEDYDQIVTVTPNLSNNLPIASAALFGPIGAGVGAVIFLAGELFKSIPEKIDNILSAQYSIKGSWDDPDIKKIGGKKESG